MYIDLEGQHKALFKKQIFTQTLAPILGSHKSFGCFRMHEENGDESFDPASIHLHRINPEDSSFFGPFVGWMSDGPVFIKTDTGFSLVGLISFVAHFEDARFVNIFQTLSPEIIGKIQSILDRPGK